MEITLKITDRYLWIPYGTVWGNMHWGHAVSRDLFNWTRCGVALMPDDTGTMYSGSGLKDEKNAAGFGKDALLFFYTAAGGNNLWSAERGAKRTQRIAVSTDGGMTLEKRGYAVEHIKGGNRDPKVFYHEESGGGAGLSLHCKKEKNFYRRLTY
ncbi:MAG: hypothetical protein K5647_04940 [Clostridiales bacterium]|nr:hypothetical protein [Clostridiales bacterium]